MRPACGRAGGRVVKAGYGVAGLAPGRGRGRFWPGVRAAADVVMDPSGREVQCVRVGRGAGKRGGGWAAREVTRGGLPVATWVTGRYGVGTLDRVPLGPVVIGGPLGETPQPPRPVV
jgi:hypothetical protein